MPVSTVVAVRDGVKILFQKDRAVIDAFKASFPKARWTGQDWLVPGKTAEKRVREWFAARDQAARAAADDRQAAVERLGADIRANGMPGIGGGSWSPNDPHFRMSLPNRPEVAALLEPLGIRWGSAQKAWLAHAEALPGLRAIASQVNEAADQVNHDIRRQRAEAIAPLLAGGHRIMRDHGSTIGIYTAYHPGIVDLLRGIPGARFERPATGSGGTWHVPATPEGMTALLAAKPDLERLHTGILEARAAEERARAEERAQHAADLARRSFAVPLERAPAPGTVIRLGERIVVVQELGKPFRISEDMPSAEGAHLLGHEAGLGCYAYHRAATPQEAAAFREDEARRMAEATAKRTAVQNLRAIGQGFQAAAERPERVAARPEGEVLLTETPGLRIYGGGVEWVLADDVLWCLQGNGADGDDWSLNNLASTIAWRMEGPRALELADRIRAIATTLGYDDVPPAGTAAPPQP